MGSRLIRPRRAATLNLFTHELQREEHMSRNVKFAILAIAIALASMILGNLPWGPG